MAIPRGYDPVTLNHWLWFKYRCHEGSPTDFQKLFEDIIKRAKPEFMQIRPYGNIGDRKCDGLFRADGTVFQVYSPDELKMQEVIDKIDEDLDGAAAFWKDELKKWIFVYNVRRGLAPDIPGCLTKKANQYPNIEIDHLSSDNLWEIARALTLQQRTEILGAPPGYEHLFFSRSATTEEIREALEKGWFAIIHDIMTPINLQSVVEAIAPDAPFGSPIWIRPAIILEETPWNEAALFQQQAVRDAIAKSRDVLPRFAIFSLSPIPLCIHLGYVLSDRVETIYFQFNRDQKNWLWSEDLIEEDLKFTVQGMPEAPLTGEQEVILRISLSANIRKEDTIAVCGDIPTQLDITVPTPSVMWLRGKAQLSALGKLFRETLASLMQLIPDCTRVHLFYAGPTGGAIIIGQQINPRMNPPINLYQFDFQNKPRFRHALTLEASNS
jgi:hypothetical protein